MFQVTASRSPEALQKAFDHLVVSVGQNNGDTRRSKTLLATLASKPEASP